MSNKLANDLIPACARLPHPAGICGALAGVELFREKDAVFEGGLFTLGIAQATLRGVDVEHAPILMTHNFQQAFGPRILP